MSVSKTHPECLTKKNDRVAALKSESALGVLAHFALAGVFPGILKTGPSGLDGVRSPEMRQPGAA